LARANAAQNAIDKSTKTIDWGKEVHGVRCALVLPTGQAPIPLGEPVKLAVLTKNFGSLEIHTAEGSPFASFKIRIQGPDGKTVPLSADGRRLLIVAEQVGVTNTVKVDPGMTRENKLHLSDIYEMKQKGQYRISLERLFYTPDGQDASTSTNILTITVGNPKPTPK